MNWEYTAIAVAGTLAAYRASGVLRVWLAYDVAMSVALKLYTVLAADHKAANHVYRLAWMAVEPVGVMLAAAVVLTRCRPRWWPVLPALGVHVWAGGFPNRWPGSWLQAEEHAIGFACMALGLVLAVEVAMYGADLWRVLSGPASSFWLVAKAEGQITTLILAALFVGTGAALYPVAWNAWLRQYVMWYQSACYLALAIAPVAPPSGLRR